MSLSNVLQSCNGGEIYRWMSTDGDKRKCQPFPNGRKLVLKHGISV